jgi:hypothetical protein
MAMTLDVPPRRNFCEQGAVSFCDETRENAREVAREMHVDQLHSKSVFQPLLNCSEFLVCILTESPAHEG